MIIKSSKSFLESSDSMKCPKCGSENFKDSDNSCEICDKSMYTNDSNQEVEKNSNNEINREKSINNKLSAKKENSEKLGILNYIIQKLQVYFPLKIIKLFIGFFKYFIICYFIIAIIYVIVFIIPSYKENKKVKNYLYNKYGKSAISEIKFHSRGFNKDFVFYDLKTYRYVYKYYSPLYPNDTFYITIWKNLDEGTTVIEEVDGGNSLGMNDNCSSTYDDTSLSTKIENDRGKTNDIYDN